MAEYMREHPFLFALLCVGIMGGTSPASVTQHYDYVDRKVTV